MDWDYERSRCWFSNDAITPEWKATAGNLPAAAPILAGLMVTLKAECEAQHARAEAAESRIAALEAERDAWKCNYEQAANNRARWINHSEAYEATLATVTQEREEARAERGELKHAMNSLNNNYCAVIEDYTEAEQALATVAQALEGLERHPIYHSEECFPADYVRWDDLAAVRALIPPGKEPT